MEPAVIERLKARVPALRTVGGALDLAALQAQNRLPPLGPAAMVVPLGLRGGPVLDAAGAFVQSVEETIGVILIFRHTDAAGDRASETVSAVIDAVIGALAGWQATPRAPDCLRLVRGQTLSGPPGSFVYALDFAAPQHLRIVP